MLSEMLALVASAHKNQIDKAGKPYFMHCYEVMLRVKSDEEAVKCIALGHDLFEDTEVTYEEVFAQFGERVAEGILSMTKPKGVSYDTYINQVLNNKDAIIVKMADLEHNSDITRMKGVTDKDLARIQKYWKTYAKLRSSL